MENQVSQPNDSPWAFALLLGFCILMLTSSIPGQPGGLGVFTDHLVNELDISRVALSSALALGTMLFGLLVPFTGQLMDRVGLNKVLLCAPIALAGMFVLLAQLPQLAQTRLPGGTLTRTALLAGCYLLIRLLAQGCMGVGSRVAMGRYFQKRRGLATGIFAAATTITFNTALPSINALGEHQGWSQSYHLIALYLLVVPTIAVVFCYKRLGSTPNATPSKPNPSQPEGIVSTVLRSRLFWIFALGIALQGMFNDSIKIHMTDLGASQGLSRSQSYQLYVPIAFVALATNLVGGWISDKLKLGRIMALMMTGQILASLGLALINTLTGQCLFILGNGLCTGFFGIMNVIVWPRLFGQQGLGRVVSLGMSVTILAVSAGPIIFSLVKSHTGSYQPLLYGWPVLSLLIIMLSWSAKEKTETHQ